VRIAHRGSVPAILLARRPPFCANRCRGPSQRNVLDAAAGGELHAK
jgi:hypothetical protein